MRHRKTPEWCLSASVDFVKSCWFVWERGRLCSQSTLVPVGTRRRMWLSFHSANLARLSKTPFGALPLPATCYRLNGALLGSSCCWRKHRLVARYQQVGLLKQPC